jgi:hypothetical protein
MVQIMLSRKEVKEIDFHEEETREQSCPGDGIIRLFTKGNRSLAGSEGGLEIGLRLMGSLVETHGGKVEALSDGLGKCR